MNDVLNPIIKNEPFRLRLFDSPPSVPNNAALVLYPLDSKEHCIVYFQTDTVFPEAIRKWHLNRLVHISLQTYEFYHTLKYSFSESRNQWIEITYKFSVSVKPDKEAIRVFLMKNLTDVSEPIIEQLNDLKVQICSCLESATLESDVFKEIKNIVAKITYLKTTVWQSSMKLDAISNKRIEDDKADKIRRAQIDAIEKKLIRDKEEADARMLEAEIAKINALKEAKLTKIRHDNEMDEQQHEIEKRTKDVAAQKAYKLQQAQNAAALAKANKELLSEFDIEDLIVADPSYKLYIDLEQEKTDRNRENTSKNFDLIRQKIDIIKDMVGSNTIDEFTASNMTQQLLGIEPKNQQQITTQGERFGGGEVIDPNIREEGNDV